jgi:3-deoxy-manno-octulosonate cytidylyltransferase (CMP-KDO synthetase)
MNKGNSMKAAVIIPARLASSRFPRKVLFNLNGKTTLEHVYRRSALALGDENVWIATCDDEIRENAGKYCPRIIMTKDTHIDCNDRSRAEGRRRYRGDRAGG